MELSELSAYAREKYGVEEQHKWDEFPGFSVLCHPQTGIWVARIFGKKPEISGELAPRA